MEATSLRRLQASILAALPVLGLVLIPEKSSAQIFGTPCDNAPAYRGAYCYNWNSPGMGALFLSQNYVIIVDAGNGYVKASTPYGSATGAWAGYGDAVLVLDNPGFLMGTSKIGCLGRNSTGRQWGFCQFIR